MSDGVRQRVHVRFAREVVGRGGEPAIGTLAQRRFEGWNWMSWLGNVVGRADGGGAGVVVVEFPGDERAVALERRRESR